MLTRLATIATLLTTPLALALPQPSPSSSTTAPSATDTPPTTSYHLQTRVLGSGHQDKDGLYVSNYHTGAGTADLTLQPLAAASPAYFNGGYQQFDLDPPEPFGVTMNDYANGTTAWNFVTTAPGYGDGGFFFDASGLQYSDAGFAGWIACDWWHGVPQLFWRYRDLDGELPGGCVGVQLLPVGI